MGEIGGDLFLHFAVTEIIVNLVSIYTVLPFERTTISDNLEASYAGFSCQVGGIFELLSCWGRGTSAPEILDFLCMFGLRTR